MTYSDGTPPNGSVEADREPTPQSVAEYIADLAAELARLARSRDLELIAYLLEMARMEAANTSRRLSAGP